MNLSTPLATLLSDNTARIVARLAVLSEDVTGRRVAELAAVPVASASRVLSDLVGTGLVDTRTVGPASLYRLNRQHVLWKPLEEMLASPAIIEQRIAETVDQHAGEAAAVAVFGSFARGGAGPESDIDLLIVWDDRVATGRRLETIDQLQESIPRLTGNRLEIVEIMESDLARMVEAEDPLVDSWWADSRSVSVRDVRSLIRRLKER